MYDIQTMNPTSAIDVSWDAYVDARRTSTEAHLVGGVPDYSFALDCSLRQKLTAMPGFKALAKAIMNTTMPRVRSELNMNGLRLGPTQMPEVYEIAVECAQRLGIGVPDVYVEDDHTMNAAAYAFEDDKPLIAVTTGILERATRGELKAVIGHECGHIHNNHVLFENLAWIIAKYGIALIPGLSQMAGYLIKPLELALNSWSRAAEVTADRAGMICSDDLACNYTLQAKLLSGGVKAEVDYDIDAIIDQYEDVRTSWGRVSELYYTHPVGVRRMLAMREFERSEVLYRWRPELRVPGQELVGMDEVDERCKAFVSVLDNKERGDRR